MLTVEFDMDTALRVRGEEVAEEYEEKGRLKGLISTAKEMLADGWDAVKVSKYTKLEPAKVREIAASL